MSRPADITSLLLAGPPPVPVSPPSLRGGGGAGAGGVPAFVVPPAVVPHSVLEGCNCPNCAAGRAAGFLGLRSPRQHARGKLASRAWQRDTGLSNPAYWAASTGTQFLRVKVTPARVKFTFSDPLAEHLTPLRAPGGRRGVIRELSDAARDRLADRAATLDAQGHEPEVMVTLTSPANWEQIYVCDQDGVSLDGGRIFKAQLKAFRKRLERFLARLGIASWSVLWFLEFQKRGAPHVHLLVFGCSMPEPVRRALRSWCGRAWSSVVGNPDPVELSKHQRAGTQVARMKKKHFGYAKKYASKMEQKEVPDDFRHVGRFWGCWNYSTPESVVLDVDYSRLNSDESAWVRRLVSQVLATVYPHSPEFVATRINKMENAVRDGIKHKFGFTVFGASAAETARPLLA